MVAPLLKRERKEILEWQIAYHLSDSWLERFFLDPFGFKTRRWQALKEQAIQTIKQAEPIGVNLRTNAHLLKLDSHASFLPTIEQEDLNLEKAKALLSHKFAKIRDNLIEFYGNEMLNENTLDTIYINRMAYLTKTANVIKKHLKESDKSELEAAEENFTYRLQLTKENAERTFQYVKKKPDTITTLPPSTNLTALILVPLVAIFIAPFQGILRLLAANQNQKRQLELQKQAQVKLQDIEVEREMQLELQQEQQLFKSRIESSQKRMIQIFTSLSHDEQIFRGQKAMEHFPNAREDLEQMGYRINQIEQQKIQLLNEVKTNPAKVSELQPFADQVVEDVKQYEQVFEKVEKIKSSPQAYEQQTTIEDSVSYLQKPHLRML